MTAVLIDGVGSIDALSQIMRDENVGLGVAAGQFRCGGHTRVLGNMGEATGALLDLAR